MGGPSSSLARSLVSSKKRPSPPVARKSLVTSVRRVGGVIGRPSARWRVTVSVPCSQRATARTPESDTMPLSRPIAGNGRGELGAGDRNRREAIVEGGGLEQLAIRELTGRHIRAQAAAVGE